MVPAISLHIKQYYPKPRYEFYHTDYGDLSPERIRKIQYINATELLVTGKVIIQQASYKTVLLSGFKTLSCLKHLI